jgi:Protocatechuate 3,4-dioxygenase beta subunit N terminal
MNERSQKQPRNITFGAKQMTLIYPVDSNKAHPAPLAPAYKSSIKRAPQKPLIPMRHTLSRGGFWERSFIDQAGALKS